MSRAVLSWKSSSGPTPRRGGNRFVAGAVLTGMTAAFGIVSIDLEKRIGVALVPEGSSRGDTRDSEPQEQDSAAPPGFGSLADTLAAHSINAAS